MIENFWKKKEKLEEAKNGHWASKRVHTSRGMQKKKKKSTKKNAKIEKRAKHLKQTSLIYCLSDFESSSSHIKKKKKV